MVQFCSSKLSYKMSYHSFVDYWTHKVVGNCQNVSRTLLLRWLQIFVPKKSESFYDREGAMMNKPSHAIPLVVSLNHTNEDHSWSKNRLSKKMKGYGKVLILTFKWVMNSGSISWVAPVNALDLIALPGWGMRKHPISSKQDFRLFLKNTALV